MTVSCLHAAPVASWQGGAGSGQSSPPPPIFTCRKIFVEKKTKFWVKNILRNLRTDNIELLGTHNILCRKFAAASRKIATSCPSPTLVTHDAAVLHDSIFRAAAAAAAVAAVSTIASDATARRYIATLSSGHCWCV